MRVIGSPVLRGILGLAGTLAAALVAVPAGASTDLSTWIETLDGSARDIPLEIAELATGRLVAVGYTRTYTSDFQDGLIVVRERDGTLVSQVSVGGAGYELLTEVEPTPDGGALAIGYTDSFGQGSYDLWLVRLDANGAVLWQRAYGGLATDEGFDLCPTRDGNFLAIGATGSFENDRMDTWVLKLSPEGAILWERSYALPLQQHGWGIEETRRGDILLTGHGEEREDEQYDLWVARLGPTGDLQWYRELGWLYLDDYSYVDGVQELWNGEILLLAESRAVSGAWLTRLAPDGSVLEEQTIGLGCSGEGSAILPTDDGGLLLTGDVYVSESQLRDAWLRKMDRDGNLEWERSYGGTRWERATQVIVTADGGLALSAWDRDYPTDDRDVMIMRLAPDGSMHESCAALIGVPSCTANTVSSLTRLRSPTDIETAAVVTLVAEPPVPATGIDGEVCAGPVPFRPREVSPRGCASPLAFADDETLTWEAGALNRSDSFCVYRSDGASLPLREYGTCLDSGLTSNTATDSEAPDTAEVFTYLVSGRNPSGESTLGYDADSLERGNLHPCP